MTGQAEGAATSVVVITRDRLNGLLTTLDRLAALPERPPVIVIDNASSADVAGAVRARFAEVRVITLERNVGSHGRTIGARAAGTPLVAFSDDDSWWAPGALARAERLFARHARLGLVAARLLVGEDERLDPTCEVMAASPLQRDPDLPGTPILGFLACGAIVRRDAFLAAGGFHPRYGVGGEEALLAVDLVCRGWGLAYVDELVAHHHPLPARNADARRRRVVRNDLWTAWLRRPVPGAVRTTVRLVVDGWAEPATWLGVLDATRGAPWVVRQRAVVPAPLERRLRQLVVRTGDA